MIGGEKFEESLLSEVNDLLGMAVEETEEHTDISISRSLLESKKACSNIGIRQRYLCYSQRENSQFKSISMNDVIISFFRKMARLCCRKKGKKPVTSDKGPKD